MYTHMCIGPVSHNSKVYLAFALPCSCKLHPRQVNYMGRHKQGRHSGGQQACLQACSSRGVCSPCDNTLPETGWRAEDDTCIYHYEGQWDADSTQAG
jgi:hypothetical protein